MTREIRCDLAADGSEAVQMWREFPHHVLLMDCQMLAMDGYTASMTSGGDAWMQAWTISPGHSPRPF